MSLKELRRHSVFGRLINQEVGFGLIDAADLLGISYRQIRRSYKRYRELGALGLTHQLRGKVGNRKWADGKKETVISWLKEGFNSALFTGFGPSILCEFLESQRKITIGRETLRRWMLELGYWEKHRKCKPHRKRRPRKEHFGEMLQLDGSFHLWFEGRGPKACLMNLVDDATGISMGHFDGEETIVSASIVLSRWISAYGVPKALYVDLRNMYGHLPTEAEMLEGEVKKSTFGKMCDKLGIKIIFARSPQAKGRVERLNGVHQDRMIKKMRVANISTMDAANAYLKDIYFKEHNDRFAVAPISSVDFHTPQSVGVDLNVVFSQEFERTISKDWVIRFEGQLFQLKPLSIYGPVSGKSALLRIHMDGTRSICYRGEPISYREIFPNTPLSRTLAMPRKKRPSLFFNPSVFEKNEGQKQLQKFKKEEKKICA